MTVRHDRLGALTAEQVRTLDAAAAARGVEVAQLMEIAGWQVARCAWRLLRRRPARLLVVAGRGNNGGDALVAARHLDSWGCKVAVHVVATAEPLRSIVARQLAALRGGRVRITVSDTGEPPLVSGAALVIDGLLGTGLRSAPREPDAAAIRALAGVRLLSIDVPSGLDATSGNVYDPCVQAAATCTLTAMKAGLWTPEGRARAGRIHVADIGMPAAAWRDSGLRAPAAVRGGALVLVPDCA